MDMRCMTANSGQAPEYEQPRQQWCRGGGGPVLKHGTEVPSPTSQLPIEMIFLGFDWEHKFAITSVLAECRGIHVPTILMIGSSQTSANRVNFQGTPQSCRHFLLVFKATTEKGSQSSRFVSSCCLHQTPPLAAPWVTNW